MNTAAGVAPSGKGLTATRIITLINFLVLCLIVWPLNAKEEEKVLNVLRRTGTGDLVLGALQVWVVASTLIATVLLLRRIVGRSRGVRPLHAASKGLVVDTVLLVAWWVVLVGMCAYAFMLGMAG